VATAGDELDEVSGSELYLDDMSFIYNPTTEPARLAEVKVPYTIYSYSNIITLDVLNQFNTLDFELYGLDENKFGKQTQ
jgi:hypothetical protein